MATTIATLEGVLRLRDAGYKRGLDRAGNQARGFRQQIGGIATGLNKVATVGALAMVPVVAGMRNAVRQSNDFNRAMTNVHSLVGNTGEEAKRLNAQILEMGGNTEHGPMKTAAAFYDIVSGVADASTHMSILNAAMSTATGGQADLAATTNVMVGAMNAYGFAADKASFVSDVLTRSVQTGVLTMDQLASALPQVTAMGADLRQDFSELAGALSLMTTTGATASVSATQMKAVFTQLLKPSELLGMEIERIGFSSGRALLEHKGLVESLNYMKDKGVIFDEVFGSVEALQGALALTKEGAREFFSEYRQGIDGATERATDIQEQAISWERLDSKMQQLWITIGDKLAPTLNQLLDEQIVPGINMLIGFWTEGDNATNSLKVLAAVAGAITMAKLIGALKAVLAVAGSVIAALNSVVALAGALGIAAGGGGIMLGQAAGRGLANTLMGDQMARGEAGLLNTVMRFSGAGLSFDEFKEQVFSHLSQQRGDLQARIGFDALRHDLMYQAYREGTGQGDGPQFRVNRGTAAGAAALYGTGRQMRGYQMGGYTGYGSSSRVAGMVHRGEYVVPQGGALVLRGGEEGGAQVAVYGPVNVNADNAEQFAREMAEAVRSL